MGNILSYIKWRGDISFAERPFNEVDNLVFAMLSYIDFSVVISELENKEVLPLNEAYRLIMEKQGGLGYKYHSLSEVPLEFIQEAAASKRFGSCNISHYTDTLDENLQIQFAALHLDIGDGTVYLAFRGTDQSILGWREDFTMSYQIVPAQMEAVKYLEKTMGTNCKYRLGGHSKGGNLAIYAAMMCNDRLKGQIVEIYDNDGPGFSREMLKKEQYSVIQPKIKRFIPAFSVIGMLFEHDCNTKIIMSSNSGLMQHDGMSWEAEGDHFLAVKDLAGDCQFINNIFDVWMENVGMEQRKVFTDNFFDALEAGGAKNINELSNKGIGGFEAILVSMVNSEKDTKAVLGKLLKSGLYNFQRIDLMKLWKTKEFFKGISIMLFGLLFMQIPGHALQILGTGTVFGIVVFTGQRLFSSFTKGNKEKNKFINRIYIIAAIVGIVFVVNSTIITLSSNISLGVLLAVNGGVKLRNLKKPTSVKSGRLWWLPWGSAIISIILGIVALTTADRVFQTFIFTVGTYMILEGLGIIIMKANSDIETA